MNTTSPGPAIHSKDDVIEDPVGNGAEQEAPQFAERVLSAVSGVSGAETIGSVQPNGARRGAPRRVAHAHAAQDETPRVR